MIVPSCSTTTLMAYYRECTLRLTVSALGRNDHSVDTRRRGDALRYLNMRLLSLIILSTCIWAADPFVGTWDMDMIKSRIDNRDLLKRVEMTFDAKNAES